MVLELGSRVSFMDPREPNTQWSLRSPGAETTHPGIVSLMAVSPDGTLLAVTSSDTRRVSLRDICSGRPAGDVAVDGDGAYKLAFAPDGGSLAVSAGRRTMAYEVRRRPCFRSIPSPNMAFDPGRLARATTGRGLAALTSRGPVYYPDPLADRRPVLIGGMLPTGRDHPSAVRPDGLVAYRVLDHVELWRPAADRRYASRSGRKTCDLDRTDGSGRRVKNPSGFGTRPTGRSWPGGRTRRQGC